MPDLKPPRVAGDDRSVLLTLLQYQRASFVRKVSGVDAADAASSPVASGNSLLWLTNHMADAESTWVLQRFANQSPSAGDTDHAPTTEEAVARYRRISNDVDAVVAAAPSLDARCPDFDGGPEINLRWILAHLLEETARHAGHADILRELLDGSVGR
jgi:hypothetical protein